MRTPVTRLREAIGTAIRSRVAGPDAAERERRIWGADGERRHHPSDVIWRVNRDAAMYAGGIRALLLQALHPSAMAGVAGHSGYRSDPWGRLQRTGEFIAMTTYGPIPAGDELIARVRSVHERVRGRTDDGTAYRASDPQLLAWVHAAETQSFLRAYQLLGPSGLSRAEADAYVASAAPVGEALGAVALPRTAAGLDALIGDYRPELRASKAALDTVDFLLRTPPVPGPARLGYWMLAAGAISTLPRWARDMLGLPTSRWFDRLVGLPLGRFATGVAGWAIATPTTAAEREHRVASMGAMSFARRQRAALADLLEELGPFAPTQCEGWQTQDLAAHLYVREHRLGALPGIGSARFAARTERIQNEALHTLGYPALVAAIRTPGWIMRPLDSLVNGSEFFIHHEDVLRANGRSQRLTEAEQQELWPVVKVLARRTQLRWKGQLRLVRTDTGAVEQLGQGSRPLTLKGTPSELLLHLSGRAADVTEVAEPDVVASWQRAIRGL